ncbi:2,3-bisphosphoglycerate-dependent phosphoglycerate mutase [Terribacillus aidingensis]|uniref:2,3-bisphosphoglycerate-dependent phosphoglycerate mutase n=1 Tax=Terribacillus aidingensis TaxID=586416 RepID=A0A285N483_9BACI|nr:histidine phosphatase family protein [Terribacillus aidingensis]SNZ04138.1 2,3-bisphosphoglycerate-dependent phosphoglycerate mutase [Terribacillus aidingensis]
MLTTLYVVRHAHSIYTPDERNRPLSETGYLDAKLVQQVLAAEQVEVKITSPYRRAWETIAADANLVIVDERLRERQIADNPAKNFKDAIQQLWMQEEFHFPGGESNKTASARGVAAFQDILASYPGKRVAIGTHGNLMTLAMGHYDTQFHYTFWKQLAMPAVWKLTFDSQQYIGAEHLCIQK